MMKESIAIIPARGGSKRIPRKNIKPFMGKPVMAYSIEAAIESGIFSEVMVSTDDPEIAEVAVKWGANVPFLRSERNSGDYATTMDVIFEVLECYGREGRHFDTVCCIYSTAPFITPERIREADRKIDEGYDSAFSVVVYGYPVQRALHLVDGNMCMLHPEYRDSRSQDLETVYHDAGQFYVSTAKALRDTRSFWGEKTAGIVLPELEVQDLDTMTDWKLAEMKYRLLGKKDGSGLK